MQDLPEHQHSTTRGEHGAAWQAAIDYGIDVSLLEWSLSLTPSERLMRHQQALELVRAVRAAGTQFYGYDPRYPPAIE